MTSRENLIRIAEYRSKHRGNKENDILLGIYGFNAIMYMSNNQLKEYITFLELDDVDIYNYITGINEIPNVYKDIVNLISMQIPQ